MEFKFLQKARSAAFSSMLTMLVLAIFSTVSYSQDDNVIINGDFSDGLTNWSSFLADWEGVTADFSVVDGEAAITNIENAGNVVWHVQFNQIFTQDQINNLEIGSTYTISFDARSSEDGRPLTMYFGEQDGGFTALKTVDYNLTTSMETYEATVVVTNTFPEMKLGFEMGLSNADVFIDNVEVVLTEDGDVEAPPMPTGFIANTDGTDDPGQMFLAVGPNDVGGDVVYRMFYSVTDQAPGDPLDATEYEFGSTPGDGDGVNAFGFILGGLDPGTEYTFWLYQYDTANDLFSEPGVAAAVSSDADEPPPPVGDNIIFNGEFSDGLDFWSTFIADFAGVSADIDVVDGEAAITNISGAGGEVWHIQLNQIFSPEQIAALEVGETYKVQFDARSSVNDRQLRMFFGQEGGGFTPVTEKNVNLTTSMETYESVFELTQTFGEMKLGFEMGLSNEDVFIDNVELVLSEEGEPEAPPMPTGFIANTDGTDDPGQMFLAVGPNDAGGDVVYRMFYSVTDQAPGDPLDATEYEFGSTPGDGDGVNAFGFILGGLDPGTEYTFWLYQYNTANDLFSEPGVASAVSSDADEPPPPVGDNIIFNGEFSDGLDFWSTFIADFAGVSADIDVVDGEAAITNISGAGGEVWHIQLNQIFSPEQIAALEVGETYKVQFDARSSVDDRQLRMFFGQEGGGFTPVTEENVNLTTSMETYESVFELTQTFGEMKLGFEMGLSNEDVFIDNVELVLSEAGEPEAPPMPGGFVVNSDNTTEDGQMFLAVGPNNVGGDIEYRLFYSVTDEAPGDPLEATEYEFGTTDGDGGGTSAFGFVLSGLEPGTEYTFWLYQYDTANDLFSEPNVASAVSSGDDEPEGPPMPEGFLVSTDNTTDDGQLFLAAGPNDVGGDIEYRLFYAVTEDIPGDPLESAEYEFGTTDGDGGGTGAFGFVLGGLEAATEYTFWLYQYDTADEVFSQPNEQSAVSSGEDDDPPPPVGDNIVINGDFSEGLDFWTTFIADFAGVSADIDVVDGEAAITNIEGAGGEVWHIQLNQIFSEEQIDALEVGESYKIQFDARSSEDGRQLRVYFGEEGGGFVSVNIEDVNLTTSMETYETVFELTQTFGAMKLGFEMGLSNADVFIDNVEMVLSEPGDPQGPPAPTGFVANTENTTDEGQLNLAVGPNNVGGDIVYRLFYSVAADAPSDPLLATEYEFGTTEGDGGGTSAFGFILSGLEAGTEYTLWLYQFNTESELFSEPNEVSAVSSGESEPPTELTLPVTFNDPDIDYGLVDFGGASSQIITDPTDESNMVVETVKSGSAEPWAGTTVGSPNGFATPIPFDPDNTTMSLRVWSPAADIPVRFKVEDSNDPTISVETEAMTTVAEEWETLVFNFANEASGTAEIDFEQDYNLATVFFNFNTSGADAGELTFYWDDMEFGGEADPDPTAPPVPIGFEASDMIGEEPVGAGEIFLSAGPNQVEEEDIEYRLFYSITADAPEDPMDATEYEFGTTPGDGEGVGPFGFVIGDLEVETEYTFWLYQYNTATDEFSDGAAEDSAVSGAQGTSIGGGDETLPKEYALSQNYPNPFNPTTQITYSLPESGNVRIDVYNMMGQLVATLVNESVSAGNHTVTFDATALASGIYLYRLQAGSNVFTKKMTLVK